MNAEDFLKKHVYDRLRNSGYYEFQAKDISEQVIRLYQQNKITSFPDLISEALRMADTHYGSSKEKQ